MKIFERNNFVHGYVKEIIIFHLLPKGFLESFVLQEFSKFQMYTNYRSPKGFFLHNNSMTTNSAIIAQIFFSKVTTLSLYKISIGIYFICDNIFFYRSHTSE